MRSPTNKSKSLAFWRSALEGQAPQITGEPQCGFYRRKLVKGGPWVPAVVWLRQEVDAQGCLTEQEELMCVVNGKLVDAEDTWLWLADNPISKEDYFNLVAKSKLRFGGDLPPANEPINLLTVDPPAFNKTEQTK